MTELEALEARWAEVDSRTCLKDRIKIGAVSIGRIDAGGAVQHAHQKARGLPPTSGVLPPFTGMGRIVNRHGHAVREIGPGLYADMQGRRIVDSKESRDRHAADCGYLVGGD